MWNYQRLAASSSVASLKCIQITNLKYVYLFAICSICYVLACSGERIALRLCEAARDVDPHQHGGHEGKDSSPTLRALQEEKTGTGDSNLLDLSVFLISSQIPCWYQKSIKILQTLNPFIKHSNYFNSFHQIALSNFSSQFEILVQLS